MNPGPGGENNAATVIEADVAVIGGGVVGHGIAWEARRSGRSVVLIDQAPGSGASWAAAGMLAPVSELHYQEEGLLELMLESSARWPGFAATLTTGGDSGYLTTPTLALGADPADRRALMDLRDVQRSHGLDVEPLTIREARSREPLLSPGISCALDIPADHQVDPRKLVRALAAELAGSGQEIAGQGIAAQGIAGQGTGVEDGFAVREHAAGLLWDSGRVRGVRLAGGGSVLAAETVVANGLAAAHLQNLPERLQLPLRPVYGDILRLRVPAHLQPLLTATVRGIVRGVPVYIVPRQDGTVVIGATQREDSVPGTSAGGVYQLLRDAQALLPAVAELELLEATARARPGTPDNAPLLGRVPAGVSASGEAGRDVAGLIIATGFFRHGVLLTPAAAAICRQLMDGITDPRWAAFRPARFSPGLSDPPGAAAPPRSGHPRMTHVTFDPSKESA
jgi:glycine oxidase